MRHEMLDRDLFCSHQPGQHRRSNAVGRTLDACEPMALGNGWSHQFANLAAVLFREHVALPSGQVSDHGPAFALSAVIGAYFVAPFAAVIVRDWNAVQPRQRAILFAWPHAFANVLVSPLAAGALDQVESNERVEHGAGFGVADLNQFPDM